MKKARFLIGLFLLIAGLSTITILGLSTLQLDKATFLETGDATTYFVLDGQPLVEESTGMAIIWIGAVVLLVAVVLLGKAFARDKEEIKNIFLLKNKWLTLLLGTFFPFFVCHVTAYSCGLPSSAKKETVQEEGFDWASYVFTLSYTFLALACFYTIMFLPQLVLANESGGIDFIMAGVITGFNFYLTLIYGTAFHDELLQSQRWLREKKYILLVT